jgi:hypothetical protein
MTETKEDLEMKKIKRYFAIVYRKEKTGFAQECYPEEREAYRRMERKAIIGDFATREEADAAVWAFLEENYGADAAVWAFLKENYKHASKEQANDSQ